MKNSLIMSLTAAFAAVGLAACGGNEEPPIPQPAPTPGPVLPEGHETVDFVPTIDPQSRATDTNFDAGDQISVWAVESDGSSAAPLLTSGNYATNLKYTCNSNGLFVANSTGVSKDAATNLNYYAVYPYSSTYRPEFKFSVKTDQSAYPNYTASDLCVAFTEPSSATTVRLPFAHALVKVVVNIDPSIADVTGVEFNALTQVLVDMNRQTVESFGNSSMINMCPDGQRSFRAIIPVMDMPKGELAAIIHTRAGNLEWHIEEAREFRSGKVYSFTLSRTDEGGQVGFTTTILPWETE